jgi:hypothetical protein
MLHPILCAVRLDDGFGLFHEKASDRWFFFSRERRACEFFAGAHNQFQAVLDDAER